MSFKNSEIGRIEMRELRYEDDANKALAPLLFEHESFDTLNYTYDQAFIRSSRVEGILS